MCFSSCACTHPRKWAQTHTHSFTCVERSFTHRRFNFPILIKALSISTLACMPADVSPPQPPPPPSHHACMTTTANTLHRCTLCNASTTCTCHSGRRSSPPDSVSGPVDVDTVTRCKASNGHACPSFSKLAQTCKTCFPSPCLLALHTNARALMKRSPALKLQPAPGALCCDARTCRTQKKCTLPQMPGAVAAACGGRVPWLLMYGGTP